MWKLLTPRNAIITVVLVLLLAACGGGGLSSYSKACYSPDGHLSSFLAVTAGHVNSFRTWRTSMLLGTGPGYSLSPSLS